MPSAHDLFAEESSMVSMSLGGHLEELRLRLVLALLGLVVGVALAAAPPLVLARRVMRGMQQPAEAALREASAARTLERVRAAEIGGGYAILPARISAGALARALREAFPDWAAPSPAREGRYVELPLELSEAVLIAMIAAYGEREDSLVALAPLETAAIFFSVCLATGFVVASPWVFYQVWAYVAAGLYRHERRLAYRFLPYSVGLFLAGVLLCYFGVLPVTLRFLLGFDAWLGVRPTMRLNDWMGFATVLPLVFGVCFQTPLVMLLLARVGIVSAADYRAQRRVAVLAIVVAAAVLTPGSEVSSMLLLAAPMLVLYELGIVLADVPARGATT